MRYGYMWFHKSYVKTHKGDEIEKLLGLEILNPERHAWRKQHTNDYEACGSKLVFEDFTIPFYCFNHLPQHG